MSTIERKEPSLAGPGGFFLILSCCLMAFYHPFLFGKGEFCFSDLTYYFQPFSAFMSDELRQGRLPLWNPNLYCGMSQLAVPSPGIFYPFTWLHVLLPFSLGLAIYLIIHQFLCGIGVYFTIKHFRLSDLAAATAGLTVALSGYMFGLSANFTLTATMAWLPLAFLCILKIHSARSWLEITGASVFIALLLLAGRPEVGLPSLVVLLGAALAPIFRKTLIADVSTDPSDIGGKPSPPISFRVTTFRLLPFAIAFLLAAPQILPALEWLKVSPRSRGLDPSSVFIWSANWYDWLCLTLNQPVGDTSLLNNTMRNLVASRPGYLPFLNSTYIGPLALTLSIWGLCIMPGRLRICMLSLLAVFAIAACGSNTPVAPALVQVFPVIGACRYPVKLCIFVILLLSVCTAFAVEALADRKIRANIILISAVTWACLLLVSGALFLFPQLSDLVKFFPWNRATSPDMNLMRQAQECFAISICAASILGLLACAMAELYRREKFTRYILTTLVTGFLAGQLTVAAVQKQCHYAPAGFFSKQSQLYSDLAGKMLFSKLDDNSSGRFLNLYFDPVSFPSWFEKSAGEGLDTRFYQYTRQVLLPNINVAFGLPNAFGYEAAETVEYKNLFKDVYRLSTQSAKSPASLKRTDEPIYRFARMTGTAYVSTHCFLKAKGRLKEMPTLAESRFELSSQNRNYNYRIYRVINPRPVAYFSDELVQVSNWREFNKTIASGEDTMSFGRTTWLLKEDWEKLAPQVKFTPVKSDSCLIKEDDGGLLKIKVEAQAPSLLVVALHFYPGWKATVDGAVVPIYRANAINSAVMVPEGTHLVEFEFDPVSLKSGIACAILGMLGLSGLFLWSLAGRGRRDVGS